MRRNLPRNRRVWLLVGAFLAAVLAGCTSAGSPSPEASPSPDSTAAPMVSPSAEETDAAETWDLVWFSDSTGNFLAALWAERIEEKLGVEVRVHDFAGPGEEGSAVFILDRIETDLEVREALAEAEVIGLYASPMHTDTGDRLADGCLSEDPTPRDPPEAYAVADFEPYADLLRSIYDRMFELRADQPTVVRAINLYTPVIDQWIAAGIEPECTAGWEAMAGTVRMVAAEYGVPAASVYDAFNGPEHNESAVDKGFIGSDRVHPSEAGNAAQVDALDALGYDPVTP